MKIIFLFIADNILLSTVNNMDVVETGFDLLELPTEDSSSSSDNSDTCVPSTETADTDGSSDENNEFMMQEVNIVQDLRPLYLKILFFLFWWTWFDCWPK